MPNGVKKYQIMRLKTEEYRKKIRDSIKKSKEEQRQYIRPKPKYDDVFEEGIKWLESVASGDIGKTFAIEYFPKISRLEESPLLLSWYYEELKNILKFPGKPDRTGIPRGEKLPLPREKQLLALFRFIYPKISLKKLSEYFNASYGVLRVWAVSSEIKDIEAQHAEDFSSYFLKEFDKKIQKSESIVVICRELAKYKNPAIVFFINNRVKNYINDLFESEKQIHEKRFEILKDHIEKGNSEIAVKMVDLIKHEYINDLLPELNGYKK